MASDFVRNIKGVRNIDILSPNITTENDLISTTDGEVYVVTNKGYKLITQSETEQVIDSMESDVKKLKTSTDNNTSEIETLKTTTDNNTSEIESLKTTTDNNTSEIETLKTLTGNNTSEIETLKKSTGNNTSEIETLKKSTSNNEKNIDSKQTLIEELQNQLNDLKSNTKKYYTLFEGNTNGVGSKIPLNDDLRSYDLIYVTCDYPGGVFTETILLKTLEDDFAFQRVNLSDSDGSFVGIYEIKLKPTSNNELEIVNDVSWDVKGRKASGANRNAFTILNIEGVK